MDMSRTLTPTEAIARVKELATAEYGPIGVMNFEFIPLPEAPGVPVNWDLAFRAAPADTEAVSYRRIRAIHIAVERVRADYPMVRWP